MKKNTNIIQIYELSGLIHTKTSDLKSQKTVFLSLQGEQYKLFWPNQPEFVRMAARFGATIVPFGTVGEDDLVEVSLCFFLPYKYLFFHFGSNGECNGKKQSPSSPSLLLCANIIVLAYNLLGRLFLITMT